MDSLDHFVYCMCPLLMRSLAHSSWMQRYVLILPAKRSNEIQSLHHCRTQRHHTNTIKPPNGHNNTAADWNPIKWLALWIFMSRTDLYELVWEGRTVKYLVEVLLLLSYFGNVEQQAPHLPSELQGNSLIDPPDQLEGNKQRGVIVRNRPSKRSGLRPPQKHTTFRPRQRGGFHIYYQKHFTLL